MLIWTFAAPEARRILVDWAEEAAALLGRFRAAAANHRGDPSFAELIDRLHATGPEAREWWDTQQVTLLGGGIKRLRHPELGRIDLRHVVLQVAEDPEHKLVVFEPTPADADRLAVLI